MTIKQDKVLNTAAAAALAAGLGFASSAAANGVDTDSLEDLRRIIEQQQRQLEALQRKVDQMMEETPADLTAAKDAPGVVKSGLDSVKLTLSGQVNRGVLVVEDGVETEVLHVDNDNSSTRMRLLGQANVTDDFSIGSQIEVEIESNSTADVSQLSGDQETDGDVSFTERKLEFYLDSKRLGRLWVGQGDTASNGVSEVDLSGTEVVGYSSIADYAGGLVFRDSDTGDPLLTPDVDGDTFTTSIGDVFSNFDGFSRDDRVRYDTPKFFGTQLSASTIAENGDDADDRWDVALRHGADYGPLKVAAAVAYGEPDTGVDYRLHGSASVLHTSGLNATIAAGTDEPKDSGRDAPTSYYAKLGYIADLFPIGKTAFAVDYQQTDDLALNGDEAKVYGAFVVQNLADYGTEFYLGVRNHELDRPGVSTDDIFAALAGARVKF